MGVAMPGRPATPLVVGALRQVIPVRPLPGKVG